MKDKRDKREEFIRAAGFKGGWVNLESWARTMVDHALETQQEENEKLVTALRFYANREHYDNDVSVNRGDGSREFSCSIFEDEGEIARWTLGL